MKIGLLTYHHSANYGAMLQSYATAQTLKELGHEVEFINLQQPEKKSPIGFLYFFRNLKYKRFREKYYPPETVKVSTKAELDEVAKKYDCLLVGSDQTWNPQISKDYYYAYFLNFGDKNIKRISYASSFGFSEWPLEIADLKQEVQDSLRKFLALSVRETTGQKLLQEEFGIQAQVVVDPTMLRLGYDEITGNINDNHKLCCYILNRTSEQMDFVRYLGKELGKKPVVLNNILPQKGCKYVYPPSVEKWIRMIGGADIVVTDSFHGAVFSILYRRNFIVVTPRTARISRLVDLLRTLGLENRIFYTVEDLEVAKPWLKPIDYARVNSIIEQKREQSYKYLSDALSSR